MLLVNVIAPTEGLYQIALIAILATPALVFVTVVSRFGSSAEGGGRVPAVGNLR